MADDGVVIVGAGAGGDAAATTLRKQGFEGSITLVGDEPHRPYERPHLSKQFLVGDSDLERVFLRPEADYEGQGITHLAGRTVVDGDLATKRLRLDDGSELSFDSLVLATGSSPRTLPGVPDVPNIQTLRTLDDAIRLKQEIDVARRILIVGAGFIGAEVAASARKLGKDVLLVEVASVPLERVLGADIGQVYADTHRAEGVDLRTGTFVAEWITSGGRLVAVLLDDASRVEVDMALIAIGVTPNVDLAARLGLPVTPFGVEVDAALQAAPNVYAVGDIAAHLHPVFNRRIRVEHWQVAQRQGAAAAGSITGEPTPYTELPWFWSDQYANNLQYVGHAAGFDRTIVRGDIHTDAFSVFYLTDGVIDATLSLNDAKSGRFSRELISNRIAITDEIAAQLADRETDMRALARSLQP